MEVNSMFTLTAESGAMRQSRSVYIILKNVNVLSK
jgi:hypothetical protein